MATEFNPWLEMGKLAERLEVTGRRDFWATLAMHAMVISGGKYDAAKLAHDAYAIADSMEMERHTEYR